MIPTDLGHGRGWLDQPAALSIKRVDRALGHPLQITDAGRTNAEQWDMWRKYGSPRAAYPGTSTHESGLAIDTDERIALLGEHGWYRPYNNPARKPYEPWHYKYVLANDQHRNDPDPSSTTTATPDESEEDDMPKNSGFYYTNNKGETTCLIANTGSGFYHEYVGGYDAYNNNLAAAFDTGNFAPISESHAVVIKAACDRVLDPTITLSIPERIAVAEPEVA